jgi:5-hydroxyisourate hydrolase
MSPITTHVLDTSTGKPARGVDVVLEFKTAADWIELARSSTNQDGRCLQLLPDGTRCAAGDYRLRFGTAAYFQAAGVPTFFPEVQIAFVVDDPASHYHVPLLVSPFGYSTYRGS